MELDAQEEYQYWYKTYKRNFKTINKLIKDMKRALFGGFGKSEAEKQLIRLMEQRIDKKDRIVYSLEVDCLVFFNARDIIINEIHRELIERLVTAFYQKIKITLFSILLPILFIY